MVVLSDNKFEDWENVSVELLLREDDRRYFIKCCRIRIEWLRMGCLAAIASPSAADFPRPRTVVKVTVDEGVFSVVASTNISIA